MFGILTRGEVIAHLQNTKDSSQFRRIRDEIEFVVNSSFDNERTRSEASTESISQKRQQLKQWRDEAKVALGKVISFINKERIKSKITNSREFETLTKECESCLSEIWLSLTRLLGMADRRLGNWKEKYDYTEAENYKNKAKENYAKLTEKITKLIDLVSRI